ncbi:hypothetical protein [Paenibacillus nasutitermitis]|uniref:Uncharacterized protein n=1 Tax=Paenibacillus nasutitermitis TaxID=1652958 RepID=A0A916Z8B1_9BACL|nr:hypothetical protein [Paenibacillus nasutitermitis]GGD79762.1 hypothetical protein GCM10010911_42310 [Paenibacillus nasutitermitis]
MSKLDGNERWKSKMLLTEHAEQYDQKQAASAVKHLTTEERVMIRDYILLPHMEKMIQKSISDVESSSNVLKRLYLAAGHKILISVAEDYYRLRGELKKRNIRVITEEQEDMVIYHKCYYRGYEERFGMTRDVMRSEISVRLTKYTAELVARLKAKG